jgi:hypothetical protein
MQAVADFFVSEARKNANAFESASAESRALIYRSIPVFTGDVSSDFEQCYFFK